MRANAPFPAPTVAFLECGKVTDALVACLLGGAMPRISEPRLKLGRGFTIKQYKER
jgi:hypothetical protein